jgi:hypothetical protein
MGGGLALAVVATLHLASAASAQSQEFDSRRHLDPADHSSACQRITFVN